MTIVPVSDISSVFPVEPNRFDLLVLVNQNIINHTETVIIPMIFLSLDLPICAVSTSRMSVQ